MDLGTSTNINAGDKELAVARIFLLNKPYEVLSQFTDDQGRATLADYISDSGVYPAGRLDYDSEGLMVLTDNGKLQDKIANPAHQQYKTYWVQVEGEATDEQLKQLSRGVELNDGMTLPGLAKRMDEPEGLWERSTPIRERQSIPTSWIMLKICEGRNRQVRRMTAAVGLPTLRLIRYAVGIWTLDGLAPGEHRVVEIALSLDSKFKKKPVARTA